MLKNDESMQLVQKGEFFGETSFMSGCNREYTIKCNTDCNLWMMGKKFYENNRSYIINSISR